MDPRSFALQTSMIRLQQEKTDALTKVVNDINDLHKRYEFHKKNSAVKLQNALESTADALADRYRRLEAVEAKINSDKPKGKRRRGCRGGKGKKA